MSVCAILALALATAGPAPTPVADEAVAIVVSVHGSVRAEAPAAAARPLAALDWLRVGTTLAVDPAGGAVLALASGRRFELRPGVRARVGAEGLDVLAGDAFELPRVPPLPRLPALAADARPGIRAGALRVRGRRLAGLYPQDAVTLADATTLVFEPLAGVSEYHVEIEDEEGESVFHAGVRGPEVVVSPGILRPGRRYAWSVRAATSSGPARGEAAFATLDEPAASAREGLRRALAAATPDASALALLAEVDRGLGLLREARDGFARAVTASPGDAALRAALDRAQRRLAEQAPPE